MTGLDLLLLCTLLFVGIAGAHRGVSATPATLAGASVGVAFAAAITARFDGLNIVGRAALLGALIALLAPLGMVGGRAICIEIYRAHQPRVNHVLGAEMMLFCALLASWLLIGILPTVSNEQFSAPVAHSDLLRAINDSVPSVRSLLHHSNGTFAAQPFTDAELNAIDEAITKSVGSSVKVTGSACGRAVSGSGAVVGSDLILTNAHVIAGMREPHVRDQGGEHAAAVMWFDSRTDVALLRIPSLNDQVLALNTSGVDDGTLAAVISYPNGGSLDSARVRIVAKRRLVSFDIYQNDAVAHEVYELEMNVQPGMSGAPVVDQSGALIGMLSGSSPEDSNRGFALTATVINDALRRVKGSVQPVPTGDCIQR